MKVSELNFNEIKENIKNYLANNTDFTDYNFEGSGLSILIDILAYNTYYNNFFLNMAINENFIGTAIKRGSLASLARNYGYVPKGYVSARMKIFIEINETNPLKMNGNVINISNTAVFTVKSDEKTYTFTPITSYNLVSSNGKYSGELELIEGVWLRQTFTPPFTKLIIPNFNIDISTLEVYERTLTNQYIRYSQVKDIKDLNSESYVYYIFENPFQQYEIYFGDGVLGKPPRNDSTIRVHYKTSDGSKANYLSNVKYEGLLIDGRFGPQQIVFRNVVPSYGGSDPEPLDNIRKNILNNFYAQDRAVTINDYRYFIEKEFPFAQSISVWGGQDNNPPIYGKVFVSIQPKRGFALGTVQKKELIDLLKKRNVVTVIPEIVDPEYTFLVVDSIIKYDSRKTAINAEDMKQIILDKIEDYNYNELSKFNSYFNYSKFITMINEIDPAIIGNITTISLKKYVEYLPNTTTTYKIDFKNSLKERSLKTLTPLKMETDKSINTLLDIFIEDEQGAIYACIINNSGQKVRLKKIGEVNYNTGEIVLTMNVSNILGRTDRIMVFVAEPKIFDVNMKYNDILVIEPTDLSIRVFAV
ncbi:MAG: hypothetical protein N3A54_00885 [Patescibacteria group bacterium]|nr:hypothetical protein [Patescibacteria group bacterium]